MRSAGGKLRASSGANDPRGQQPLGMRWVRVAHPGCCFPHLDPGPLVSSGSSTRRQAGWVPHLSVQLFIGEIYEDAGEECGMTTSFRRFNPKSHTFPKAPPLPGSPSRSGTVPARECGARRGDRRTGAGA